MNLWHYGLRIRLFLIGSSIVFVEFYFISYHKLFCLSDFDDVVAHQAKLLHTKIIAICNVSLCNIYDYLECTECDI